MPVSLSKGGKVSLTKAAADSGVASLSQVTVGLGWDINRYDGGGEFDLDSSVFLCDGSGHCRSQKDFIFYGNTTGQGIHHTGDNRTGVGDGDDEQIVITLGDIDPAIEKIAFAITIYESEVRNQNFGMVENCYVRIFDALSGTEIIRYDLSEDFSIETALVVGELYKNNGEWKFKAIGSGFSGGLAALCTNYGIEVS